MILLGTIILCVAVAAGVMGVLYYLNLLPGFERDTSRTSREAISPGCLLSLLAFSAVWFVAWSVVLVLALRFLQTPLQ